MRYHGPTLTSLVFFSVSRIHPQKELKCIDIEAASGLSWGTFLLWQRPDNIPVSKWHWPTLAIPQMIMRIMIEGKPHQPVSSTFTHLSLIAVNGVVCGCTVVPPKIFSSAGVKIFTNIMSLLQQQTNKQSNTTIFICRSVPSGYYPCP